MSYRRSQATLLGWPDHWYDTDGKPICIAKDCPRVFSTLKAMKERKSHYQQLSGDPRTKVDHDILIHINRQITCPYCEFREKRQIKALFDHETSLHGTTNMSSIEGFATLVRLGLQTEEVLDHAKESIFYRMMIIVERSQEFGPLSRYVKSRQPAYGSQKAPSSSNLSHDELKMVLSPAGSRPNGPGPPFWDPIHPDDFLMHLEPHSTDPFDLEWRPFWMNMRSAYGKGQI
ncbi:hypothetical protein MMC28_004503 [Mycoblastus sanguinarius]|nr:hypothetical protein [Mycoblastus sanguinarius]